MVNQYIAYCGLYCEHCFSRTHIAPTANTLQNYMKRQGFETFGPYMPNYKEFWEFLNVLFDAEGCPGCGKNGGSPACGMRTCAREKGVDACPFAIQCVQTNNGFEFTNRLSSKKTKSLTLFERRLAALGIEHKRICPFTPRHNGKVERSHRKDNEYFYAAHRFYSLNDFKRQLAVHSRKNYNFSMRPFSWLSHRATLANFFADGVTHH